MLAYGMWLRVSEIVNITIRDIDSKSMQVHIRTAKGKKGSVCALAPGYFNHFKGLLY